METKTTDNRILRFRLVTFVGILAFAISATFTITTIYNRFLFIEGELEKVNIQIQEVEDNVNRRIDVKTKRNEDNIREINNLIAQ